MPLGNTGQYQTFDAVENQYRMQTPGSSSGGLLDMATADGRYVRKDTPVAQSMAGALALPADGLTVGTNQIKMSSGKVGIGRTPATYPLEVQGDIYATGVIRGDASGLSNVNATAYKGEGTPSAIEFGYLTGTTSNIQNQINGRLASAFATVTDGAASAVAAGAGTLRVRAAGIVSVVVANDDPTFGDNLLISASVPFAAPTASVGLATVAGSASTAMRSDAAPALDQAISPVWTSLHTFASNGLIAPTIGRAAGQHHAVPAVDSDTLGLLAAAQAFINKTYNGLTISTTTGVLNVSNGKTLAVQNSITLNASADGFTATFPASGTSAMGAATLTVATANAVATANHTHAITTSSNPGAVASILASSAAGALTLVNLYTTGAAGIGTTNPGAYQLFVNGTMRVDSDLLLGAAVANLFLKDTSTGWQAASTTVITPQAGNAVRSTSFTSGLLGWNVAADGSAEFNNIRARGEIASAVFKVNEIAATAGTQGIFFSASNLSRDDSLPGAVGNAFNFQAENSDAGGMLFGVGDIIRFKAWTGAGVSDAWATVTARTNNGSTTTYNATLSAGSTGTMLRAGMAAVDYGPAGSCFITLSTDGTVGAAPNLTMGTHSGTPWAGFTTLLRLGNLNGAYGYASNVYGFATGQYGVAATSWITIDQTNGFRVGTFTTTLAQWTTSGTIIVGQVGAGQSNVFISAGVVQLRNNTTALIQLNANGSAFFGNGNLAISTAGVLTVGSWTVNSASISSGGITLAASVTAANNKIYVGTGSFNNSNTAFYVDGSGQFSLKDKLTWDGTTLIINGSGTFSGALSAATGSFNGTITGGGGNVIINTDGLSIAAGTTTANEIKWLSGSHVASSIGVNVSMGHAERNDFVIAPSHASSSVYWQMQGVTDSGWYARMELVSRESDNTSFICFSGQSPNFKGISISTASEVTPIAMLDVYGAANIRGSLTVDTNALCVDAALNRVGIGTAAPQATFDVTADTPVIRGNWTSMVAADNFGAFAWYENGSLQAVWQQIGTAFSAVARRGSMEFVNFGSGAGAAVSFWTNATQRLTIDVTGLVGIGTTVPAVSGTGKLHLQGNTFRLDTARTPATASAAGNVGEICWDVNYVYVCVAASTWKRAALATW